MGIYGFSAQKSGTIKIGFTADTDSADWVVNENRSL